MDIGFTILFTVFSLNLLLGLVVLFQSKSDLHQYIFFLITIAVAIWAISLFAYNFESSEYVALIFSRTAYLSAFSSAMFFLDFTISFTGAYKNKQLLIIVNLILLAIAGYLAYSPYVVIGIEDFEGQQNLIFGFLYYPYIISLLCIILAAFLIFFGALKETHDVTRKMQYKYIIAGVLLATVGGIGTNLILPTLGILQLYWLGPIFSVIIVVFTAIAILKYNLFNLKVIATELFIFTLWIFLLIRALISDSYQELTINASLFILTVAIGILLIRSVLREVHQREHIQELANKLERTNEQLKQFLSFATHQIRSPLTAIRGYASMLINGDYEEINEKQKQPIQTILRSSEDLIKIVNDFLNVSRIEQGRMKYDKKHINVIDLVKEVVNEYKPNVQERGLELMYKNPYEDDVITIDADKHKLKQVFGNIIDNSIKYTNKGSITISVKKKDSIIHIEISDTGIGMNPDELEKIFKMFERGSDASKTNESGTGLGIYLARNITEAHGGTLHAESDGQGKGSTFVVRLPEVSDKESAESEEH